MLGTCLANKPCVTVSPVWPHPGWVSPSLHSIHLTAQNALPDHLAPIPHLAFCTPTPVQACHPRAPSIFWCAEQVSKWARNTGHVYAETWKLLLHGPLGSWLRSPGAPGMASEVRKTGITLALPGVCNARRRGSLLRVHPTGGPRLACGFLHTGL